ncbi:MAG: AAA family ATPase [Lachnospiraceae bacterium]|nr:AAA family ATPase [Lachnospiraceae bacterium]
MFARDERLIDQCVSAYLSNTPVIYILTDEMDFVDTVILDQSMVELRRWKGDNPDKIKPEPIPEKEQGRYLAETEDVVRESTELGTVSWKKNVRLYPAGNVINPLAYVKSYGSRCPVILGVKNYNLAIKAAGPDGIHKTEGNLQRYVMSHLSAPKNSALKRSVLILAAPKLILPEGLEEYVAVVEPDPLKSWEIKEIIRDCAADHEEILDPNYIEELVDRLKGFNQRKIQSVLAKIIYEAGYLANNRYTADRPENQRPEAVAFEMINREKRQMLSKEGILDYAQISREPTVGGMEGLMNYLEEKCHFVLNHRMELKRCKGIDLPKGVLVCGIPGTGKSLMAKKIASMLNIPLISMDMGNITKSRLGESAQAMRKALRVADSMAPCVLWIDEIEKAFAGMKGAKGDSASSEVARCFGMFLKWMQEQGEIKNEGDEPVSPCFIFATSNNVSQLPPEFLRSGRFERKYYVFMPTEEECIRIFKADIANMAKITDEAGNQMEVLDSRELNDRFWREIMEYCVAGQDGEPRRKFLTGADIHEINQDALRRMVYAEYGGGTPEYEGKDAKGRYQILEKNFKARPMTVKPYSAEVYGRMLRKAIDEARPYGETNLRDIAECYIALHENKFNPVSGEKDALIPFDEYRGEEECPVDVSDERALALHGDSRYDREMYQYIGAKINQLKGAAQAARSAVKRGSS